MTTSVSFLEPAPVAVSAAPDAAIPVSASAAVKPQVVVDEALLRRAVEELNRHFSSMRTDLKFSVEKDLNRIVVAVIDAQDGSVLRQIPSEEALRIARMLESGRSALIEAHA